MDSSDTASIRSAGGGGFEGAYSNTLVNQEVLNNMFFV